MQDECIHAEGQRRDRGGAHALLASKVYILACRNFLHDTFQEGNDLREGGALSVMIPQACVQRQGIRERHIRGQIGVRRVDVVLPKVRVVCASSRCPTACPSSLVCAEEDVCGV